jgi:AcrR family transcriptional regulator
MSNARITIGSLRREQIVEAAVAVIAEQGLQNLSLSEIEKKAGMSRGQLTYYFPAKEDILLAVFDRLLQLTYQRIGTPAGAECRQPGGREWVRHLMERLVGRPAVHPEFECLQYTFLSQIAHREDFRRRLASLYEEWRTRMAEGLEGDLVRPVSPRTLATVIQALLHGLAVQAVADPQAFDAGEIVDLCLDMVGHYLGGFVKAEKSAANQSSVTANGSAETLKVNQRRRPKRENHERDHR